MVFSGYHFPLVFLVPRVLQCLLQKSPDESTASEQSNASTPNADYRVCGPKRGNILVDFNVCVTISEVDVSMGVW